MDNSEGFILKIVVLAGGFSCERDVSLSSGAMIAAALKRRGHETALVDLFLGVGEDDPYSPDINPISVGASAPDLQKLLTLKAGMGEVGKGVIELLSDADIVYLGLHGASGENGRLQAMLDMLGIRYTGSGYLASALAMNKPLSKLVLEQQNIPTARGFVQKKGMPLPNIKLPCVIKPSSGGSSIGVSIVFCEEDLIEALNKGFMYEDVLLIEEYVSGKELSVAVLDGKALPVIEICPKNGYYDYKNKYQPGAATEICPALIESTIYERLQRTAEEVYFALGLSVYGRVDFILRPDGTFVCLEANTLPGMTPTSLVPQEAAAAGMSYDELCEFIIKKSLEKYGN